MIIVAGARPEAQRILRLAYHFEGADPPGFYERAPSAARPSRQHRNPIVVAQEWQRMLDEGQCVSRANLARKLGVTRARVTQVLGLLDLAPDIIEALATIGDPLPRSIVTERSLRPLLKLPVEEQRRALVAIAPSQWN